MELKELKTSKGERRKNSGKEREMGLREFVFHYWADRSNCGNVSISMALACRAADRRSPGLYPHHQLRATEIDFVWCLVHRGVKAELGCSGAAGSTHGTVASFAGAASTPSVVGHLHASRSCRDSEVGATDADQSQGEPQRHHHHCK